MSSIHQCKDGGRDITGRGTPQSYVPCSTKGGKLFPLTAGERVEVVDYGDCPQGGVLSPNDNCILNLVGTFVEMVPSTNYNLFDDRVRVQIDDYKGQSIVGNYNQNEIVKSLGFLPPPPAEVFGCMDSTATNYNSSATQDDGTCDYPAILPPEEAVEEIIIEEIDEKPITAGMGDSKMIWYIVGAGMILFIAKQQKWF